MKFRMIYHFYLKERRSEKLVAKLHDKTEYVIHIRNLNQALSHGLVLKELHREIKSNQKTWVKPYIDMNTDLRKAAQNDFQQ